MEEWKEIEGYTNYEVSNLGRVKSKARYTNTGIIHSSQVFRKERILKPRKDRNGYLRVQLFSGQEGKDYVLSRLVAKAFIKEDLSSEDHICFKNKDRADCRAENLGIINAEEHKFQPSKYYTYYGVECSIHKLSKMSGLKKHIIWKRLERLKWNVYEAAEIPPRKLRKGEEC